MSGRAQETTIIRRDVEVESDDTTLKSRRIQIENQGIRGKIGTVYHTATIILLISYNSGRLPKQKIMDYDIPEEDQSQVKFRE